MSLNHFINKIHRKLVHLRLRPIRVFCLHQVCLEYDPLRCTKNDWISVTSFMESMKVMLKNYSFISLTEAHHKLFTDYLRFKHYAVLSFDDGYRSNLLVLKWLDTQRIPYVLFLNGKYLNGQSCSLHLLENARRVKADINEIELADNLYLLPEDIRQMSAQIGSHGFEHLDATGLPRAGVKDLIQLNYAVFDQERINTIPFHAYTWGLRNKTTDEVLTELGIIPVLMDGQKNYDDSSVIHRELFPID